MNRSNVGKEVDERNAVPPRETEVASASDENVANTGEQSRVANRETDAGNTGGDGG